MPPDVARQGSRLEAISLGFVDIWEKEADFTAEGAEMGLWDFAGF